MIVYEGIVKEYPKICSRCNEKIRWNEGKINNTGFCECNNHLWFYQIVGYKIAYKDLKRNPISKTFRYKKIVCDDFKEFDKEKFLKEFMKNKESNTK